MDSLSFCIEAIHLASAKPQAVFIEQQPLLSAFCQNYFLNIISLTVCSVTKVTCIIHDRNKIVLKYI